MIEIVTLAPHDPLPAGPGRCVIVLQTLKEDDPGQTTVQIVLTGHPDEVTHPRGTDGKPMHLDQAIEAARRVAESEGLKRLYVVDRAKGGREQDILQHGGDHSVHMEQLADRDPEDGERGSDMRDLVHRS